MMSRLSFFLDVDWARLATLSNTTLRPRGFRHSFSPRFVPVVLVRTAQCLYESGWSRLAKLPALANFVLFGIEVPPRLSIGAGLVLMHTQGTVLGAASKVLGGVTLGHGSMVGANAVVLKDVLPGHVAIGIPAKILPPKCERLQGNSVELKE